MVRVSVGHSPTSKGLSGEQRVVEVASGGVVGESPKSKLAKSARFSECASPGQFDHLPLIQIERADGPESGKRTGNKNAALNPMAKTMFNARSQKIRHKLNVEKDYSTYILG